ncbi:hypothetical protein J4526_03150 [Desulfurococcaceae archaeon MEX13E-LK6-19]|nr:hypothetical protein J4526_03150 [Desulfurococcaceae archaeon MEX13E-LK6-19]
MEIEFEKDILNIREFVEKALHLEKKAYSDYKDTLMRTSNKFVLESLITITLETLIHREIFRGLLEALNLFVRERDKLLYKEIERGSQEIELLYQAIVNHLNIEKNMIKMLSEIISYIKEMSNKYPRYKTTLEMIASILDAIRENEEHHHEKIAEIISLIRVR